MVFFQGKEPPNRHGVECIRDVGSDTAVSIDQTPPD